MRAGAQNERASADLRDRSSETPSGLACFVLWFCVMFVIVVCVAGLHRCTATPVLRDCSQVQSCRRYTLLRPFSSCVDLYRNPEYSTAVAGLVLSSRPVQRQRLVAKPRPRRETSRTRIDSRTCSPSSTSTEVYFLALIALHASTSSRRASASFARAFSLSPAPFLLGKPPGKPDFSGCGTP